MVNTGGTRLVTDLFQPGTDRPLPHIRLMVNGRDIPFLNEVETVLRDGDEFSIIPIVTGG